MQLGFIPFASKEKVPYHAENHEKILASTVIPDVELEKLMFSPVRQNRSTTEPTLIEEIRQINESSGLCWRENLFHWPPVFSIDSWSELQDRHRQLILKTETER